MLQPVKQNGTRQFRVKLNDFVVASFRNKLNPGEIEAEAGAQIKRLQSAGVQPSHFDTHKHAHMFPAVLRPLLRAARERGVPAVRNPFGQVWPLPMGDLLRTRKLWLRFAELNVGCATLQPGFAARSKPTACAQLTDRWPCWSPGFST